MVPAGLRLTRIDPVETGSPYFFEDFVAGERIDHVDGMGVMESENRLATRLYQNGARVHFNDHTERQGRLGACIVYGGVVMSLARALSFNGLGNGLHLLAINGGSHVNPCRAGDTVYAWSEVLETAELAGRSDVGALRLRLVATKDRPCHDFPLRDEAGKLSAGRSCSTSTTGSWCRAVRLPPEGRNWSCGKPGCRLNRLSARTSVRMRASRSGSAHASTT